MGRSAKGLFVYGFDLGGDETGWKVQGAGEYGQWTPSWLNSEDDDEGRENIETAIEDRLVVTLGGFTETDWRTEGHFDRRRAAQAAMGVELRRYSSSDYPLFFLAAFAEASYDDPEVLDPAQLLTRCVMEDWDGKLLAACEALGIVPLQEKPQWFVSSCVS